MYLPTYTLAPIRYLYIHEYRFHNHRSIVYIVYTYTRYRFLGRITSGATVVIKYRPTQEPTTSTYIIILYYTTTTIPAAALCPTRIYSIMTIITIT